MNPNYKYTIFDVETTGLDNNNDHIIQIGLVQFDHNFEIIKKYETYINPPIEVTKLKNIVGFITNIDPLELIHYPSIMDVQDQIGEFFGEDVVVIGHNINFDIGFLRKYIYIDFANIIDTLPLTRNLIHYQASYAQENLHIHLLNTSAKYKQYIAQITQGQIKHHDAMYDSLVNFAILRYLVDYIYILTSKYPRICNHIINSNYRSILCNCKTQNIQYQIPKFANIYIPKYNNTEHPSYINLDKQRAWDKIYIGNMNIEQIMIDLAKNPKIIISSNSSSKLQIIKDIYIRNGIKGFGWLKPSQNINYEILDDRSRTNLDNDEVGFLIKYISHHDSGLSVIDLNNEIDYKIYNLIRQDKIISAENIILCTHNGLLANIDNELLSEYTIVLLDNDWWYSSFLKFLSIPVSVQNSLYIVDNIRYKYTKLAKIKENKNIKIERKKDGIIDQVDNIYINFVMLFGMLNMDMREFLANKKSDDDGRYAINHINGNDRDFWRSKYIYIKLIDLVEKLYIYSDFLGDDYKLIVDQIAKINNVFTKFTTVSEKIDYQGYQEYIYINNNNHVTYDEFREFFGEKKVVVISNFDQIGQKINISDEDKSENISDIYINKPQVETKSKANITEIIEDLGEKQCIYIYSNSKNKAKVYFDKVIEMGADKKYDVFVENITGGMGKIIGLVKNSDKYIIIGGYELYMGLINKGVKISNIYTIGSIGLMHNQIINDMKWRVV